MLQRYYSLYCALITAWYGDCIVDCILTDFKQSEYNNGQYSFFGMTTEPDITTALPIDWNQVVLGKMQIYIPGCIVEKTDNKALCAVILHQLYEGCFYSLDNDNPPDLKRLYKRLHLLKSDYKEIELSDCLLVSNEKKKNFIEKNVCYEKLTKFMEVDTKCTT